MRNPCDPLDNDGAFKTDVGMTEKSASSRKTILLMTILAFTTSFSNSMMYCSVNTAINSFQLFVNESLMV